MESCSHGTDTGPDTPTPSQYTDMGRPVIVLSLTTTHFNVLGLVEPLPRPSKHEADASLQCYRGSYHTEARLQVYLTVRVANLSSWSDNPNHSEIISLMNETPHQWIAQRQVCPVSVYCDGAGCLVLCLRHGIPVW